MKAITDRLRKPYTIYILLFILCLLPEAVYLRKLGFYWDDWSQLFLHVKFGDGAFPEYFSYNRPLSAWTDILFFPLCGSSPLRWHLLLLLLRWILTSLVYKISRLLLPENIRLCLAAAVLYAVCPLFSQYHISIAYSQHFTDGILFALSLLFLLKACDTDTKPRFWTLYGLSILTALLHLTVSEYFAFLELIKLLMVFFFLRRTGKKGAIAQTARKCGPHLIIFIFYCVYRMNISKFFPNFGAETPDLLYLMLRSPAEGLRSLLKDTAVDFLYPFTGFIGELFRFDLNRILTATELTAIGVSLITALCAVLYLYAKKTDLSRQSAFPILLTSVIGILLGLCPFLVMGGNYLSSDDFIHADRIFLVCEPFVCLIFALTLSALFEDRKLFAVMIGAAVFLFSHGQMTKFTEARTLAAKQNDLYHQLAIRMPGLRDGTAIVDDSIIFPEQGNFATASALNVLYPNPIRENGEVPLWVFSYDTRRYESHAGFTVQNRNYRFTRPPGDLIYIDHDNKFANCVWILSPEDTDNPHLTDLQRSWALGSDIGRIDTEQTLLPDRLIFGEAPRNWCASYQQAALLRQTEDWTALQTLAHNVLEAGFTPSDTRSNSPYEWWPFIEGLYRAGEKDLAEALSEEAVRYDESYEEFYRVRTSLLP